MPSNSVFSFKLFETHFTLQAGMAYWVVALIIIAFAAVCGC